MHGCIVRNNEVIIPMDRFKNEHLHGMCYFYKDCDNLMENCLCRLHPDKKPKLCQELNEDNARCGIYMLTPNCILKGETYESENKIIDVEGKEINKEN